MKKLRHEKIKVSFLEAFADIPPQPAGMKLRVQISPDTITFMSFRTISVARNFAQKWGYFFLVAPFFFLLAVGFLNTAVRLLFSHLPVSSDGLGTPLPRWEVLTFIVPAWTVATMIAGFSTYSILIFAYRLTPERPAWELEILERRWLVTIYHEKIQSGAESNLERRYLKPFEIAELGVDEESHVYCDEVTYKIGRDKYGRDSSRRVSKCVVLTPPLSPVEAAWVEQALRSVLTLALGSP